MDREYRSLEAVDDGLLDDMTRLEDNQLYAAGMKVVQDILHEMSVVGRTRRTGTELSIDATPVENKVACGAFALGKLDASKPGRSIKICPHG